MRLNLSPATSHAMPYNLCCAILGHKTAFSVDIDETRMVGELKDEIKAKKAHALSSYDADSLVLYKVNINIPDNGDNDEAYHQVIAKISQNTTYTQEIQNLSAEQQVLTNPLRRLSTIFGELSPVDTGIRILVELPPGESVDSIDPGVWCVAETGPISSAMPTADESELIDSPALFLCQLLRHFYNSATIRTQAKRDR